MKIASGANTVSEYQYDGAKRRVVQKSYVSGTLNETLHLHYTEPGQWQVVEERVGSSTDANRQFVWGRRYIDDLILRDRDTDGNGTLDERLYSLQDAKWNVTGLVHSSGVVGTLTAIELAKLLALPGIALAALYALLRCEPIVIDLPTTPDPSILDPPCTCCCIFRGYGWWMYQGEMRTSACVAQGSPKRPCGCDQTNATTCRGMPDIDVARPR